METLKNAAKTHQQPLSSAGLVVCAAVLNVSIIIFSRPYCARVGGPCQLCRTTRVDASRASAHLWPAIRPRRCHHTHTSPAFIGRDYLPPPYPQRHLRVQTPPRGLFFRRPDSNICPHHKRKLFIDTTSTKSNLLWSVWRGGRWGEPLQQSATQLNYHNQNKPRAVPAT